MPTPSVTPSVLPTNLTLGPAASQQGVTAIPLYAAPPTRPLPYLLCAQALAKRSLVLTELGEVDRLHAQNHSRAPVLLLEGDHLLGARQNRTIIASTLLGGRGAAALPVACVERGRWSGPSEQFEAAAIVAPASVRRIVKTSVTRSMLRQHTRGVAAGDRVANQDAIWQEIAAQQRRLRVQSATSSLAHSFTERTRDVSAISAALPYPEAARGLALALGDELLSIDLFDQERTCRHYWPQLVAGAALEALGRPSRRDATRVPAHLRVLLDRLAVAAWQRVPPVSEGQELRVELDDLAASALLSQGHLLHLGVVTAVIRSRPKPVRHDLPSSLAARYRVLSRIGAGGAKEVFRAVELASGKDVAIARIPGVLAHELEEEAALSRKIGGGHTAEVYEYLIDEYEDGYLVMEHCGGPSLAQLAGAGLSVQEAGPLLLAFARALAAIHQAQVLHRDIKLENVLLCGSEPAPRLKIIDFGVAARARRQTTDVGPLPFRGTFPYMGSEVLRGESLDARADVFAFGVCCYRLLTGEFPLPPQDTESTFDYLQRLRSVTRHDVSRLPRLPAAAAVMISRMLEMQPEPRPYMPEVLAAFEHAFGALPLRIPPSAAAGPGGPGGPSTPPPPWPWPGSTPPGELLPLWWRVPVAVAAPEHVIVAPCAHAPLIVLSPGSETTSVAAFGDGGRERWRIQVPGRLTAGLRADLDGDGLRELYLAGEHHLAMVTARGELRYARARADREDRARSGLAAGDRDASGLLELSRPTAPGTPTLMAIADAHSPRLVLDGRALEPRTGRDTGPLPFAYEGDGRQLVEARELTGISYNGHALQAFRGSRGTGAAIVQHPGATQFTVAQLETAGPRVQLAVYGPGGRRLHALPVAACEVPTGDRLTISQLAAHPLVDPIHAPLALLGEGGAAVVITPLLATAPWLPPTLAAFLLPAGRELWRVQLSATNARVLLADLDGDGKPELAVGTGEYLNLYEPWTGATSMPLPCRGLPVAFGDPFGGGVACLITASADGIEVRRGAACRPLTMQWSGPRGDLWRTGTVTRAGTPVGPI